MGGRDCDIKKKNKKTKKRAIKANTATVAQALGPDRLPAWQKYFRPHPRWRGGGAVSVGGSGRVDTGLAPWRPRPPPWL